MRGLLVLHGPYDNIELRIAQHQAAETPSYTSTRRPVECVYAENCGTRLEALTFEHQIKGWSRAKKEALIRGDWKKVSELAKPRDTHPSTSSGRTV